MKAKYLLVFLFGMIVFSSCKKDIEIQEKSSTTSNSTIKTEGGNIAGRESTIVVDDVVSWLEGQMDTSKPIQCEMITHIMLNWDVQNMHVETLNAEENLVIIPIPDEYYTQHVSVGKNPLQYLVLVEDYRGEIRRGDVALFYNVDSTITALPENSFRDFFQKELISTDGTFVLITLDDIKQYEVNFDNGVKTQFKLWTSKVPENQPSCLWYYLVTTYYNSDGTTYEVWEFMAQICQQEGGGGGGGVQPGVPVNGILRVFSIKEDPAHYWVHGTYTFNGTRFAITANDLFTAAAPAGNSIVSHWGTAGSPGDTWHSVWNQYTNTATVGTPALTATATVTGRLSFVHPSQNNYYLDINETTTWQAATVIQ